MTIYPEALAEHLAREVTTACHCWRLTRADGVVSGFTDHDRPLTVDGTLFEPETGFSASEARDTLGLAVDTVDVEGALSSARISEADIAAGLYDGATVETLLVNWRRPQDFVVLRKATIGRITRSDGGGFGAGRICKRLVFARHDQLDDGPTRRAQRAHCRPSQGCSRRYTDAATRWRAAGWGRRCFHGQGRMRQDLHYM